MTQKQKQQYTLIFLVLLIVCGIVLAHDYSVAGSINKLFAIILGIVTLIYIVLMLQKPKKRTGYFDEKVKEEEEQ